METRNRGEAVIGSGDGALGQRGDLLQELAHGQEAALTERIDFLQRAGVFLSKRARRINRTSNLLRVLLIVLGAITASKGSLEAVLGSGKETDLAFFAVVGLLVSLCSGFQAAFKFDTRAAELVGLAAECWSAAHAAIVGRLERPDALAELLIRPE